MKQLESPLFECLKSGGAGEVTVNLIRAEELYRLSRSRLTGYILTNQSEEKLGQIYGNKKEHIEGILAHGDGEHLHQQALEYYAGYISHLHNYPEAEIHTMADNWEDAAGELFECIWSLFPDYEYEPWNVPRPEMPPKPEAVELRRTLNGLGFFETNRKRKPAYRQDFKPSMHGVAKHIRNN